MSGSGTIHLFPGVTELAAPAAPTVAGEPYAPVIEALERLMKDAKSGRLVAFAAALVDKDNHISTDGACIENATTAHLLVASVAYLHHDQVANTIDALERIEEEQEVSEPDPA
jgi:hypothetical protein